MKKLVILIALIVGLAGSVWATGTEALLFYNKGLDFYKMGLYDEAVTNFKKAVEADPEFTDAYYNLGSVYEFLQQYDEALSVFKQVIIRNPEDYDSVYRAAWLSYKTGDNEHAATYLSLIPSTSSRAQDAKNLYGLLGIEPKWMDTSSIPEKKVDRANDIYDGITSPTGLAVDRDGNIYAAQFGLNSVLKITPDGKKILYIKDSKINGPVGIAFDLAGNLYIANYNANNILKVSYAGEISVLISNVSKPYGVVVNNGTLYVSLQGSSSVLKYKLDR